MSRASIVTTATALLLSGGRPAGGHTLSYEEQASSEQLSRQTQPSAPHQCGTIGTFTAVGRDDCCLPGHVVALRVFKSLDRRKFGMMLECRLTTLSGQQHKTLSLSH